MNKDLMLETVSFFGIDENENRTKQIISLNHSYGIEDLADEYIKRLEGFGCFGVQRGRLQGTLFDVSYTQKDIVDPKKIIYDTVIISNVNFFDYTLLQQLIIHPYIKKIAELFNNTKELKELIDLKYIQ